MGIPSTSEIKDTHDGTNYMQENSSNTPKEYPHKTKSIFIPKYLIFILTDIIIKVYIYLKAIFCLFSF